MNNRTDNPQTRAAIVFTGAEEKLWLFLKKHLSTQKKNPAFYSALESLAEEPSGIRNVVIHLNEIQNETNSLNIQEKPFSELGLNKTEASQLTTLLKACQYPDAAAEQDQITSYISDCENGMRQTQVTLEKILSEYACEKDSKNLKLVIDLLGLLPKGYSSTREHDFFESRNAAIRIMDFLILAINTPEKVSESFPQFKFNQTDFLKSVKGKFKDYPKLLNGIECLEIIRDGLSILNPPEQKPQAKTQVEIEAERKAETEKEKKEFEADAEKIEAENAQLIKKTEEDITFDSTQVAQETKNLRANLNLTVDEETKQLLAELDDPNESDENKEESAVKPQALPVTENQSSTTHTQATQKPILADGQSKTIQAAQTPPNNPAPVLKENYQVLYFYRQHIFANQKTLLANPDNRLEKIAKAIDGFFSWIAGKEVKSATRTLENSFFKPKSEHGKKLVDHASQIHFNINRK